jgi:site-specific DNA recombinase
MNAVAYTRISNLDQSNYSLDSQRRQIIDYCTRNNLTLLKIYEDNGESSYTFDRKAFEKLEKEIKQAQYLIVYHLDRFSRNMAEAMIKIKQYLEVGIKVRDISEPPEMDDYDPNTFMMRSMKFMVAESELHRIRQRTKNGMVQSALAGRHSNMAPVGFKNARDGSNKPILVIDDEKAFAIRILYREYLNGMNIEELRRMVKRYGFDPKGNSKIQYILANPVYAGYVKVPATKNKPAHLVKGLHDPIISEQDYWLVQERLKGKTNTVQNRKDVPLRGVLHCGCGRKLTAGNSKGKSRYYWYYVCNTCKQNLSATKLHRQFDDLLDNLSFDAKTLQEFRSRLTKKLNDYLIGRGEKMKQAQKQLELVENRISAVEEKYLRGGNVSEASYNKVIAELRSDQSRLFKELAKANTNQQAYWDKLNQILAIVSDVRRAFANLPIEKKHQFVNWVFDSALSYENDIYRTPYLLELFADNALTLKEKGLLEIVAPVRNLGETPNRTRDESCIEHPILQDIDFLCNLFIGVA